MSVVLALTIHNKQQIKCTSGRINEETLRLLFLHDNRETSVLTGEVSEESVQFRFIRTGCLANLKGFLGLMLGKTVVMRLSHSFKTDRQRGDLDNKDYVEVPHTTTPDTHSNPRPRHVP